MGKFQYMMFGDGRDLFLFGDFPQTKRAIDIFLIPTFAQYQLHHLRRDKLCPFPQRYFVQLIYRQE